MQNYIKQKPGGRLRQCIRKSTGGRSQHNTWSFSKSWPYGPTADLQVMDDDQCTNEKPADIINDLMEECSQFESELKCVNATSTNIESMKKLLVTLNSEVTKLQKIAADKSAGRKYEWLKEINPVKSPYYPQKGDRVVYLEQAHQEYIEQVRKHHIYNIYEPEEIWKRIIFKTHEIVDVVSIYYEKHQLCSVCRLELQWVNRDGKACGDTFKVTYFSTKNLVEYLVLLQDFEAGVKRTWNVGDKFQQMIHDEWHFGKIVAIQPYDEQYSDSHYKRFDVCMDDGSSRKISSWELYPIDPLRLPGTIDSRVRVLPNEFRKLSYQSSTQGSSWYNGRETVCQEICESLDEIMEQDIIVPIIDLCDDKIYYSVFSYPVDLITIKNRLSNSFYRHFEALMYDMDQLIENIEYISGKFWKNDGDVCWQKGLIISQNSDLITLILTRITRMMRNVEGKCHSLDSSLKVSDMTQNISSCIDTFNAASKCIIESEGEGIQLENFNWRIACEKLLDCVWTNENSILLRQPNNLCIDYLRHFPKPTNFEDIREYLKNVYSTPVEFQYAMDSLFLNSSQNSDKENPKFDQCKKLENIYRVNINKILMLWTSTASSEKLIEGSRKRPLNCVNSTDSSSKVRSPQSPILQAPTNKKNRSNKK